MGKAPKTISTAKELYALAADPAGAYELTDHIDMSGEVWAPVDFSGCLWGNGYEIRNLQVETAGTVGFFGTLTGKVTDLHLRNARICADGAAYAGVLAGVIEGSAENCTVTGQIVSAEGVVGAMAGKVTGRCLGGTAVTAKTGPHEETGLCADVWMPGKNRLVGETDENPVITGLWRDNSYAMKLCPQVLQDRRQRAVDYMRSMATVLWRIDQDKLEYIKNRNAPKCVHYQIYERGKTYMGIPYAHSGGGLARFLSVMAREEKGVYTTIPDLKNGEYYVGEVAESLAHEGICVKDNYGFTQYMGNDCSSALSWAWRQISSVDMAEGGCYGRYSGNMIPTEANKKNHGILPVGDFFACSEDTRLVLEEVGEEAIYEAYAKAVTGDGLCGYDTSGHVLILSYDPMVIRMADGKLDPEKSFVVTIEQGGGFYDAKGTDNLFKENLPEPIQYSWRVDYRYCFRNLAHNGNYDNLAETRKFCGCDHIYLPITMQALQVECTPAVTPRVWVEGSTVYSNFYIAATQLDGAPVHTQISHDWHIYREFPTTSVDLAKTHGLKNGQYTAKIHLSNQQVETVRFTVA